LTRPIGPTDRKSSMTMRTSRKTVTFARPFVLGGTGEEFPAGIYTI